MTHPDFWQQVNQRVNENKTIMQSGFSPKLAPPLAWVGLHFWIIGGFLSLILTIWLFANHCPFVRFLNDGEHTRSKS